MKIQHLRIRQKSGNDKEILRTLLQVCNDKLLVLQASFALLDVVRRGKRSGAPVGLPVHPAYALPGLPDALPALAGAARVPAVAVLLPLRPLALVLAPVRPGEGLRGRRGDRRRGALSALCDKERI